MTLTHTLIHTDKHSSTVRSYITTQYNLSFTEKRELDAFQTKLHNLKDY